MWRPVSSSPTTTRKAARSLSQAGTQKALGSSNRLSRDPQAPTLCSQSTPTQVQRAESSSSLSSSSSSLKRNGDGSSNNPKGSGSIVGTHLSRPPKVRSPSISNEPSISSRTTTPRSSVSGSSCLNDVQDMGDEVMGEGICVAVRARPLSDVEISCYGACLLALLCWPILFQARF